MKNALPSPSGVAVAFDAVSSFIGLLSVEGVLLEANASALAAGGLGRDDVIGRPFWEAGWWSYSGAVQDELRDAVHRAGRGEAVQYVVEVLAADGGRSLVPIDFRLTPVHGSDGDVEFLVPEGHPLVGGPSADESYARAVAELAAAKRDSGSLARLTSALAGASSVDEVAAALCRDAPEVVGASFVSVVMVGGDELRRFDPGRGGASSSWVSAPLDPNTPAGDAAIRGEPVILGTDADPAGLASVSAYPLSWGTPKTVKAVLELGWTSGHRSGGGTDPSSIVTLGATALQRGWMSDELRRTEALLRTVVTQAPIGMAFFDADCRFQMINERLAEINGHSVDDHIGRAIADVVPDLAEQALPLFRSVMASGEPVTGIEIVGETPAKPGVTQVWEEGLYPVTATDGEVIGIGAVVEDVTERRAAQRQLEQLARTLQAGLLPQRLARPDGWEVAVRYRASTDRLDVGGDWYEFDEIDDGGDLVVTIGDVVGHDLQAAIAMSQLRNALVGLGHAYHDPAEILVHLDHYANNTDDCFGTALFYGRLDPLSGTLRYSNAGHLPPLVVTAERTAHYLYDSLHPPLGLQCSRSTASTNLGAGDTLICYTDGLVERRGELLDLGLERLASHASSIRSDCSAADLVEHLVTSLDAEVQDDDVAVLVLKRTPTR